MSLKRLESFLNQYNPISPAERLAGRLIGLLSDEESNFVAEGDMTTTPVALFLYKGDTLHTIALNAQHDIKVFVACIEDDSEFYGIAYETGDPTVFRPYREPLLDDMPLILAVDKERKAVHVVQPYREANDDTGKNQAVRQGEHSDMAQVQQQTDGKISRMWHNNGVEVQA